MVGLQCDGPTGTMCCEGEDSRISDKSVAGDGGNSVNDCEGDVMGDCSGMGVDAGVDCDNSNDSYCDEGDGNLGYEDWGDSGRGGVSCHPVQGPCHCLLW